MVRITLEEIKDAKPKIDRSKIEATPEEDILKHMKEDGEDPQVQFIDFIEELPPHKIHEQLQMTQVEFARVLSIPVSTLRNWEQERVRIDPAARALFHILKKDPEHALKALKPERKASKIYIKWRLSYAQQNESDLLGGNSY